MVTKIKDLIHSTQENDKKIIGLPVNYETGFQRASNGTIYGFAEGNKITLSEEGMNPNAPVHEYTHLGARAVEQKNPKLWKKFVDLAKQTDVWEEVMNDPNYSDIQQYDSRVASEVLSRLTGRLHGKMSTEEARKLIADKKETADADTLIKKIKMILNDIWKWIGENVFDMKPEQFSTWEDVSHKAIYDFWSSTDLCCGLLSDSLPLRCIYNSILGVTFPVSNQSHISHL